MDCFTHCARSNIVRPLSYAALDENGRSMVLWQKSGTRLTYIENHMLNGANCHFKEVINLAVVQLTASDLTGTQGTNDKFGKLIVRSYPGLEGSRVLDVLPEEVSGLKSQGDLCEIEYTEPGSTAAKTLVVNKRDLDALAKGRPMAEVLAGARSLRGRPRSNGS